jgi:hypothetical protein
MLAVWRQREDTESQGPKATERKLTSWGASGTRWSRILAAAAGAAATAWFATRVLSGPPVVPGVAVLAAAFAVALAPRLGWLLLIFAAILVLVMQDKPGGALVLGLAALPVIILLFRHGDRWPAPAVTPALALLGLGGLWPALAGRAGAWRQRVVLGLTGWVWLIMGDLLSGRDGYVHLPAGLRDPTAWMGSLHDTVHHVLPTVVSVGLLAPALVWAAGALVLPLVLRSPVLGARIFLILGWAAAVPLLTGAVLSAFPAGGSLSAAQAALGGLACLALLLIVGALRDVHESIGSSDTRAGLA